MSGFVPMPPAPQSPEASVVKADGWFPEIDVNEMRAAMRLRGEVPHPRLVEAIRGGILTATIDLSQWKAAWVEQGKASLSAVKPDDMIDEEHRLTMLFTRAVRFYAAAELADLARDSSATQDEVDRIDEESLIAPDMKRIALQAVRDMLGVGRCDVELI